MNKSVIKIYKSKTRNHTYKPYAWSIPLNEPFSTFLLDMLVVEIFYF